MLSNLTLLLQKTQTAMCSTRRQILRQMDLLPRSNSITLRRPCPRPSGPRTQNPNTIFGLEYPLLKWRYLERTVHALGTAISTLLSKYTPIVAFSDCSSAIRRTQQALYPLGPAVGHLQHGTTPQRNAIAERKSAGPTQRMKGMVRYSC